ncbi:hypothetical protein pipiens_009250 [Culex pipiens pipiens]|uniref:Uncharacterized protein n=1 Tax=Culex pipiens pipiens TaxID=38569 RepID=A0ABD1DEH2_CULPP
MFSISSMPGNELVETTDPGHYRPKNKSWKHRVQPYIRTDAAGVHCHIVGDSVCPYVQKKLRIDNLLRHFCALHEREAKERGLWRRTRMVVVLKRRRRRRSKPGRNWRRK